MFSKVLIISKDTESTVFLGNLLQYVNTITVKKLFLWTGFFVFQFVPTASISVSGKSSISTLFPRTNTPHSPHWVFKHIEKIFPSLLFFSWIDNGSSLSLSSWQMPPFFNQFGGSSQDPFQCVHVDLVLGSPKEDTALQKLPHQYSVEVHHLLITSQVQDLHFPLHLTAKSC